MNALCVLILQPRKQMARTIAHAIEAIGHRARLCEKKEDAASDFRAHGCEAAVIHVSLARSPDLRAAREIRALPQGAHVPIILTAESGTNPLVLEKLGEQLQATAFVLSDDNASVLARVLEDIIHRSPTKPATNRGQEAFHRDLMTTGTTREQGERQTKVDDEPENEDGKTTWTSDDDLDATHEGLAVEAQAKLIERGIKAKGDLAATPFPRLLKTFAELRTTGALAISQLESDRKTTTGGTPKKIVYFKNGIPVYVQSNLVHECLGRLLIRLGKISPSVLDASVARMRQDRMPQGQALMEMGALSEPELEQALREQLRRKLFDLFGWRLASYQLSTDVAQFPGVIELELSLAEVIFEGVVRKIPPERLLRILEPHMQAYVVPNPDKAEMFLRMDLVEEAKETLLRLDGTEQLRALLQKAPRRPGAVAQILYAMSSLEAVWFLPEAHPSSRLEDPNKHAPSLGRPQMSQSTSNSTTAQAPVPSQDEPFETTEITSGETPNQRPRSKIRPVEQGNPEHMDPESVDRQVELSFQAERIFRTAKRMLAQRKHKEAIALFAHAERLCPTEPELIAYHAYARHVASGPDRDQSMLALKSLERLTEAAPYLYEGHLFYARVLEALGQPTAAKAAYRQAMTLDKERTEAEEDLSRLASEPDGM
ncbi:MAG: DUF4388 domain-containing protein [Myxococcales bacterium]|nr:DUF4388 domain-containing protein [Myxococcales bacterium]